MYILHGRNDLSQKGYGVVNKHHVTPALFTPLNFTRPGPIPHFPSPFRVDYKYVLFTFENQKLNGEILYQLKEGEMPGFYDPIEIIDISENQKLLVLEIAGGRGRDSEAVAFGVVHDKIKKVLEYPDWADETTPGQGNGMESLLLPQANGNLRIFWHRWELNLTNDEGGEDSASKVDKYSEIFYHFDSNQEKYLNIGLEKELPTKSASIEWNNLSE